ncbi:MAG TPA: hypothetical protein VKZ60_08825 [Chloroflexota bacterium]|nr:hypothetical protein [Chloroflexota bacterium]
MTFDGAATLMFSPLGWLIIYAWVFVCLTAVQLTVRLIRRWDLRETALAALWLTLAALLVSVVYVHLVNSTTDPATLAQLREQGEAAGSGERLVQLYVVNQRLRWMWLAALPLGLASWVVARRVLAMRPRSALVCAVAMAVLIAPWHTLFLT